MLEMSYTEQLLTAAVVSEGLRPILAQCETGAPSDLLSLIKRCWDPNPLCRPSFDDIVEELNLIMEHAEKVSCPPLVSPSNQCQNGMMDLQYFKELNWFDQGEQSARITNAGKSNIGLWASSFNESHYHPTLSWGSFATRGRRETMEDTHFMLPQMCNENDVHAFGIFDGHRGLPMTVLLLFLFITRV